MPVALTLPGTSGKSHSQLTIFPSGSVEATALNLTASPILGVAGAKVNLAIGGTLVTSMLWEMETTAFVSYVTSRVTRYVPAFAKACARF